MIIQEQYFDSFLRYYRNGEVLYESERVSGDSARGLLQCCADHGFRGAVREGTSREPVRG